MALLVNNNQIFLLPNAQTTFYWTFSNEDTVAILTPKPETIGFGNDNQRIELSAPTARLINTTGGTSIRYTVRVRNIGGNSGLWVRLTAVTFGET